MITKDRVTDVILRVLDAFKAFHESTSNESFKESLGYCIERGFPFGESGAHPESNMLVPIPIYSVKEQSYEVLFNWSMENSEIFESCVIIWSSILLKYATLCYIEDLGCECCFTDAGVSLYDEDCFDTFIRAVDETLNYLDKHFPKGWGEEDTSVYEEINQEIPLYCLC